MYNLQRFLDAQEYDYSIALKEIKAGMKMSHWMWYIFPQLKELGHSPTAKYYGIENLKEAKEYYKHPVLKERLLEITDSLLQISSNDPTEVMGYPDDLKLKSSMTLFYEVSKNKIFKDVLDKYYNGEMDVLTLDYIKST